MLSRARSLFIKLKFVDCRGTNGSQSCRRSHARAAHCFVFHLNYSCVKFYCNCELMVDEMNWSSSHAGSHGSCVLTYAFQANSCRFRTRSGSYVYLPDTSYLGCGIHSSPCTQVCKLNTKIQSSSSLPRPNCKSDTLLFVYPQLKIIIDDLSQRAQYSRFEDGFLTPP